VAKLLYLGKRSRPDILTTAFLSTRVLKATEEDWKKLVKLVRYLRGTERLGIRLEANDPTVVMAYVDASFGVHADMRSHSGVVISPGRGPVYASSSRQRINTKSSTEAEEGSGPVASQGDAWDSNSDVHVPRCARRTYAECGVRVLPVGDNHPVCV
jgi:hypothetical protein